MSNEAGAVISTHSHGEPELTEERTERALKDLGRILGGGGPLDRDALRRWKLDGLMREGPMTQFAIGTITWDKSIGRPATASLASGFEIEAWRWHEVMIYTPGGVVFQKIRSPYVVSAWDGSGDEDRWRVNYLVGGLQSPAENVVAVRLASVGWKIPGMFSIGAAGFRAMKPSAVGFTKAEATVLPDFEVVINGFADL